MDVMQAHSPAGAICLPDLDVSIWLFGSELSDSWFSKEEIMSLERYPR